MKRLFLALFLAFSIFTPILAQSKITLREKLALNYCRNPSIQGELVILTDIKNEVTICRFVYSQGYNNESSMTIEELQAFVNDLQYMKRHIDFCTVNNDTMKEYEISLLCENSQGTSVFAYSQGERVGIEFKLNENSKALYISKKKFDNIVDFFSDSLSEIKKMKGLDTYPSEFKTIENTIDKNKSSVLAVNEK